jgi:ribosomal protein L16/L10AE
LNLNYLRARKHIFKKRTLKFHHRNFFLKIGTAGLYSLTTQRFELVYLRGFKRLIRRRYIRRRMRFRRRKFWLFLRPNCILSCKSLNSRMGAGVGSLVRIATILKSYKSFVEFKNYSPQWIRKIANRTRFRYPLTFTVHTKK